MLSRLLLIIVQAAEEKKLELQKLVECKSTKLLSFLTEQQAEVEANRKKDELAIADFHVARSAKKP